MGTYFKRLPLLFTTNLERTLAMLMPLADYLGQLEPPLTVFQVILLICYLISQLKHLLSEGTNR